MHLSPHAFRRRVDEALALIPAEFRPHLEGVPILIEDADQALAGERAREALLFHLVNLARAANAFTLITARLLPDHWGVATAEIARRRAVAAGGR